MNKERRLGRGLEALLGRLPDAPASDGAAPAAGIGAAAATLDAPSRAGAASLDAPPSAWPAAVPAIVAKSRNRVPIADIDTNPFQPRQEFDAADIQNLANSLREHGMLQPVVVRRAADRYQLVAGERRLRAAALAGWSDVPVQLIEADDRRMAELAIVENLQRKDLNALEKAASFERYLATYGGTQEDLAARLQIDRSTVANLIRLLELPDEVKQALVRGELTAGHARALLPLGDEREQVATCRRIMDEGLSVRAVEALVQEVIHSSDDRTLSLITATGERTTAGRTARSDQISELEQEFRMALGAKVDVRQSTKERGKIVIHFKSHEEFDRLRAALCGGKKSKTHVS